MEVARTRRNKHLHIWRCERRPGGNAAGLQARSSPGLWCRPLAPLTVQAPEGRGGNARPTSGTRWARLPRCCLPLSTRWQQRGAREELLCSRGENLDIHAAASPSSLGSVIVDQHPHYIHIEILTLPSGYGGNLMSVSHTDRCSGSDLSPVHRMGIVAARPARCGCEVTCLTRNECSNTLAKVISIPSLLPQGRTGDNTVQRPQIAREVMQIQGKP